MISDNQLYAWGNWKLKQDSLPGWPRISILIKQMIFGKRNKKESIVYETEINDAQFHHAAMEELDGLINDLPSHEDIRLLILFYATRPKPKKKQLAREFNCHPSTIYGRLDRIKKVLDNDPTNLRQYTTIRFYPKRKISIQVDRLKNT